MHYALKLQLPCGWRSATALYKRNRACAFRDYPECRCRAVHSADVQRYRDRFSGPLLDRIDIHVEVPAVKYQDLAGDSTGEPSHLDP